MSLRCYRDQTVAEILSDSVTRMVMDADGIDATELESDVEARGAKLACGFSSPAQGMAYSQAMTVTAAGKPHLLGSTP